MITEEILPFLDKFKNEIQLTGIDVSNYNMDHIAYQASSAPDYDRLKEKFTEFTSLIHEANVNERRVGVFKLNEPIKYDNNVITALEIVEPKKNQDVQSGWEHAEYVIDEPFETLMEKYPLLAWNTESMNREDYQHLKLQLSPDMQVKFHHNTILDTIIYEQSK